MTRPPTADLPLTVPWAAGSAVATPRVCAVVADVVRSAVLERVKRDRLKLDDEVAQWLRALQVGAGVYRQRPEVAQPVAGATPSELRSENVLDVKTVAQRLDVTPQAVRKRCAPGTLGARKNAQGAWDIYEEGL